MNEAAVDSQQFVELTDFPLPRLLFRLLSKRFTGTLRVAQPPEGTTRTVWFRGGMPIATDWEVQGSRLGELAVAQGLVSQAVLDDVLASEGGGVRLGERLAAAGVEASQIWNALRTQCIRRLIDMFALEEGTVVLAGASCEGSDDLLQVNALELIQRGITAAYDVARVRHELGAQVSATFSATAAAGRYLDQFRFRSEDASILAFVATGAAADLTALGQLPGTTAQRAAQVVYALWSCNMLDAAVPEIAAEIDPNDPAQFAAALAALEHKLHDAAEPTAILALPPDADLAAIEGAWSRLAERFDPATLAPEVDDDVRERVAAVHEALASVRTAARQRRQALAELGGMRMIRDGKYARGLALLEEAEAVGNVGPEVVVALTWARLQIGARTPTDLKRAEAALDRQLAAHERLALAHYYRGFVYSWQNRPKEAIAAFDRALVLDPNLVDAARQVRALRAGEVVEAPKKKEDPGFPKFKLEAEPKHELLTRSWKRVYWFVGFVVLLLVIVNVVLRLDADF